MMKKTLLALAAVGIVALGCDGSTSTTPTADGPAFAAGGNPVVHQASVGGADVCGGLGLQPGCDANFSMIAQERADGTDSGKWTDIFAKGAGGIHVDVDCLNVVGNEAWVSGIIRDGNFGDQDLAGLPALTRVSDNGTSSNDPADQISFSFIGLALTCDDAPNLPLVDLTAGQVKVK